MYVVNDWQRQECVNRRGRAVIVKDDQDDWTERWPFIRSESIVLNTKGVADELVEIWCQ
jgi:hypothetical protein